MKKTHEGTTLIESLLILVIISLIGATGYYVLRSKDNANKTYDHTATTKLAGEQKAESSVQPSKAVAGALEIKEWAVKVKVMGDISDSTYKISGNTAWLSTEKLNLDKQCADYSQKDFPTFQGIERLSADDANPGYGGGTVAQNFTKDPVAYIKIGQHYYFFEHGNGTMCDAETSNIYSAFQEAFKTLTSD